MNSQPSRFKLHHLTAILGLLFFLATMLAGKTGLPLLAICILLIILLELSLQCRKNSYYLPYWLMILSPTLLIKYSSIIDFRIRTICFICFLFIFSFALHRHRLAINKFSLLKSKPVTIWLIALLIFLASSSIFHFRGIQLSGDEPHYLMITQSLVEDGDFDLKNNFENKTYYDFLPIDLRFHGTNHRGKSLSFHLPGLSFLLIPFYLLYKLLVSWIPPALFFRHAASILNAFYACLLFYVLKKTFPGKNITTFWLLLVLCFPIIFHAPHLYPELPAATLFMAAYLIWRQSSVSLIWVGLPLSVIPWFHVKFIPALLFLTAIILYKTFKTSTERKGKDFTKIIKLGIFPIISLILLLAYCKSLYNTFNPANIFPKESYWSVPFLLRMKVFFSYFIDQRDGLFLYSPVLFLSLFGLKRKFKHRGLLVTIALIYISFHAFTSVRGAYAPAGRPLIFVSWILMVLAANFIFNHSSSQGDRFYDSIIKFTGGLSVFVMIWLFYYPLFIYQPVFSGTLERASGLNLFLGSNTIPIWQFFPSFLTSPPKDHPANYVWLVVLSTMLLLYYLDIFNKFQWQFFTVHRKKIWLGFFAITIFLYCFHPHVHLINKNKFTNKVISFFNNSRNFHFLKDRQGFRIKGGNNYDIFIDRKYPGQNSITFHFNNTHQIDLVIRNGRKKLFTSTRDISNTYSFKLSSLKVLQVGGQQVSHLGFETSTPSKNSFLWLEIQ